MNDTYYDMNKTYVVIPYLDRRSALLFLNMINFIL